MSLIIAKALLVLVLVLCIPFAVASPVHGEEQSQDFGHQDLPTLQLKKEHDLTLEMAKAADTLAARLTSGDEVKVVELKEMHDFFKNFVDACHHGKEEQYYFPVALLAKPEFAGVVTTLKRHHQMGKELIGGLKRATEIWREQGDFARKEAADNLTAYAALLRRHIELETTGLMNQVQKAFSPEQRDLVRAGFHYVEAQQLGEGFHEKYHDLAMTILERYRSS